MKRFYGLDLIAAELTGQGCLKEGMERLMLDHPSHWQRYCHGNDTDQRLQRHYSYSDRIRYYWAMPEARTLVERLLAKLGDRLIPETLIAQYLAPLWPGAVSGNIAPRPVPLLIASVANILDLYDAACNANTSAPILG